MAQAAARPWPAVAAAAAAASVASAPPAAPGSGARHFRAPPPRALYQSAAEKRRAPTVRRAHPTPWKEERGGGEGKKAARSPSAAQPRHHPPHRPASLGFFRSSPAFRSGGVGEARKHRVLSRRQRFPPRHLAPWAVPRRRAAGPALGDGGVVPRGVAGAGAVLFPLMAAALTLPPPPPARAMEPPAGPERGTRGRGGRLPLCLSAERAEGDAAAELPRPALRGRYRGSGRPPAARGGLGELSRSLAWQMGGPAGQREEEQPGTETFPPAGRERRVVGEGMVAPPSPARLGSAGLKFGLLPPELHARLLDQEDYKSRTQAVEELKRVVGGASQATVTSMPAPSLLGLISFLYTLLDDSNFKVVLGALEVIDLLALRLGDRVPAFLAPLVSAAAKVLGDNKLAIRQEYGRLFLRLMKAAGPRQVLGLLLQQEYLQHKNSKVREEVVNICIMALLTHPSEELDLAKLAFGLAPALVDSKRRVRHAAMEAFAALASSMGPGKTGLLFKAVDAVELEDNGDGVMHAVQARLARKTLPKLVDQGFVEYAVPLPSSGHNRGSSLPPGADTDWLLMGSRTQSAHSYCGYHARDDALQNSSSHGAYADQGISSRRVLSAGKGKNKLPWENEHAGDREGGSGVKMPFTKGVEQVRTCSSFILGHVPKGDLKVDKGLLSNRYLRGMANTANI